mmetsp:Transcript_52787/g.94937  ORF Transcript_52787/g.94937 Transcript_52787/m.94937 type:complete len:108 (+) Transcript_52787:54-377(+)
MIMSDYRNCKSCGESVMRERERERERKADSDSAPPGPSECCGQPDTSGEQLLVRRSRQAHPIFWPAQKGSSRAACSNAAGRLPPRVLRWLADALHALLGYNSCTSIA